MQFSRGKKKPSATEPTSAGNTVTEMRLNRACHYPRPSLIFSRAMLRWYARISSSSTMYPSEELLERQLQLGSEIAVLKRAVFWPAPETEPSSWLETADRLEKLEGQQAAIAMVLDGREKQERALEQVMPSRTFPLAPPTSAPSSSPPTSTAAGVERDPFETE